MQTSSIEHARQANESNGPDTHADETDHLPGPYARSFANRALDVTVAAGLLIITGPVLGASVLLVRIIDGSPVFYRGERLGLGAQPFTITKIRTLRSDAQRQVGGELLGKGHQRLKTRTGNFLRETRLDELPQLVHVIQGRMALFGPRPERPEVYAAKCQEIHGYADRFLVRPGLFGYAQILTPHGTPKRVRALIDRRFVLAPRNALFDAALLTLTLASLAQEVSTRLGTFAGSQWQQRVLHRYSEQRGARRLALTSGQAFLTPSRSSHLRIPVVDATEDALRAEGRGLQYLVKGSTAALLLVDRRSGRTRRAQVRLTNVLEHRQSSTGTLVARYEPSSENSEYMIDQYLLNRSIVRLPNWIRVRRFAAEAAEPEA